jgi:hypothetical protein
MFGKNIIGLLLCMMPLASCAPEKEVLPVPPDQAAFQTAWDQSDGYQTRLLQQIPHEITHWTGKVVVKNTFYMGTQWEVHLFVVQVAKNLAFAAYGYDPKVRSDFPNAGYYVQFSGVKVDNPAGPIQAYLEIAGMEKLALVEIKLTSVTVPRDTRRGNGL